MSEPLNRIRIKIGEHELPMTVSPEQEVRLRAAGRILNERIKQFREEYGLPDQNVLPMVALTAVADQLLAEQQRDAGSGGFQQRLEHLHDLLLAAPTGPGSGAGGGAGGPAGRETGAPRRAPGSSRDGASAFTGTDS